MGVDSDVARLAVAKDPSIETEFVDASGIHFEVDTCGDPASQKLALLLHGFPEHASCWRYQLPLFARLGYRAWAPNQRGYGNTTRPEKVEDYRMDRLVADAAALIDVSGCSSVTLVGDDWGGAVAWAFALRSERPLDRLIVINIPHPVRFAEGLRTWAQRRRSWYMLFFQLPWLPEFVLRLGGARAIGHAFRGMAIDKRRFPDEVVRVYRQNALQPGAMTAMINWYRANLSLLRDVVASPRLETPTLMIWGDEDAVLGKELTNGTEELVSDFTLRHLPGVSHWAQQEAPEAVNAMIEAWLTDIPVPEAEWGGRLLTS